MAVERANTQIYWGTVMNNSVVVTISTDVRYEAAHFLPNVGKHHQCSRMHGHSYVLTVSVTGPVDQHTGFVMDFSDLKAAISVHRDKFDHHTINDLIPNPTVENQLYWWAENLCDIPGLSRLHLQETATNSATIYL